MMTLLPNLAGTNFCRDLGIPTDEGLLLAYIPIIDAVPQETEYREGTRSYTLSAMDGVAIDLMPRDGKAVKWWLVKNAARETGLDFPQEIWSGPAVDFTVESIPELPQPDRTVLAIRQYSRGPWIKLQAEDENAEE